MAGREGAREIGREGVWIVRILRVRDGRGEGEGSGRIGRGEEGRVKYKDVNCKV